MLQSVRRYLAAGAVVLGLSPMASHAAPIAYEFSGVIAAVQLDAGRIFPGASIGDAFQVRIWLDDSLPNISYSPTTGIYGDAIYSNGQPAGFTSVIDAVLTVGGTTRSFLFDNGNDVAAQSLSVYDGASIYYAGGRVVEVEGVALNVSPAAGRSDSNNYYAYLRYWQESPVGSGLTGAAGLLPGTQLPTFLDGIGGEGARMDFGYFWGPTNANGLSSYIGGSLTGVQIVQDAAPNPASQPWPAPAGVSPDSPLMPSSSFFNPATGATTFNFEAVIEDPDATLWIDPPVAVGYEYFLYSDSETQSFMSVVIDTDVGDGLYDLSWYDSEIDGYQYAVIGVGEIFYFNGDGTYEFTIGGIEPEAQLDPSNPLAFVAGVTFRETGPVYVSQTALTQDYVTPVPESGAVALTLAGLALVFAVGRVRAGRRQ